MPSSSGETGGGQLGWLVFLRRGLASWATSVCHLHGWRCSCWPGLGLWSAIEYLRRFSLPLRRGRRTVHLGYTRTTSGLLWQRARATAFSSLSQAPSLQRTFAFAFVRTLAATFGTLALSFDWICTSPFFPTPSFLSPDFWWYWKVAGGFSCGSLSLSRPVAVIVLLVLHQRSFRFGPGSSLAFACLRACKRSAWFFRPGISWISTRIV